MLRLIYVVMFAFTAPMLYVANGDRQATAAEPTKQEYPQENEFKSIEDARAVEKQLIVLSNKVAPAVVQLWTLGEEKRYLGSGVVIHPSGLILTHGHHDQPIETILGATFTGGKTVEATVQSAFSSRGGPDFSLLKIQNPGKYPFVPLRREKPPSPLRDAFISSIQVSWLSSGYLRRRCCVWGAFPALDEPLLMPTA